MSQVIELHPRKPSRPPPPPPRLVRWLPWLRRSAELLALVWVLVIAIVFALRFTFPLELEWMEGGSLQQALRMQRGQPVYGPPSPDFVPFLYTPLYPALLALLGTIVPLGYGLARAVSIVSVIAIALALWRLCAIEDKPRAHRLLAIGLFLSGYVFGFRWLDVGRGDSLFLALLIWGLVVLRESEGSVRKAALAGLLIALAFWTKQTTAVFVLVSGVAGLLIAPRQLWVYVATIALVAGGGVLLGQWLTEGWLWTWIYETHQTHEFNDERFRKKTWGMFVHATPALALLTLILAGATLGLAIRRVRQFSRLARERDQFGVRTWLAGVWVAMRAKRGPIYWGLLALAGLFVSALGYATQYAEPNAFLPGILLGSAFLAVALPDGLSDDASGELPAMRRILESVGLGLIGLQLIFALLVEPIYQPIQDRGLEQGLAESYAWQDPWRTLPTSEQRDDARALRERIEGLEGEGLLALHRPWWSVLAGGEGHVGAMGLNDVDPETRAALQTELRRRVAAGEVGAIWIEGSVPKWLTLALRGWSVALRLSGDDRVRPLSGWMSEAGMVTPWRGEQLLLVRGPAWSLELPAGAERIADFEDGGLAGFEVVAGVGFSRRAARSLESGMPPVGPHGGERLLSSATGPTRLAAQGEVRSPPITIPKGGALELWIGSSGPSDRLLATLIADDDSERSVALAIPDTRFALAPLRWSVPDELAEVPLRLHLIDRSANAALFVDDLWLWRAAPPE
ncbi:hypothetical protein ACNOYE_16365 [Nannocystaceae bacterium ST9]